MRQQTKAARAPNRVLRGIVRHIASDKNATAKTRLEACKIYALVAGLDLRKACLNGEVAAVEEDETDALADLAKLVK